MNNLSERVQREFSEWKEKYEVPYHMEFYVKALLKLQEEYDNVEASSNTTRTRDTLLHMINDLYKNMLLKERKKTPNYNYTVMIIGDKPQLVVIKKLIEMISKEFVMDKQIVKLSNGISLYFMSKDKDKIRGYKFNDYIDLTNDKQFQTDVLKPILRMSI